MAYGATLTLPTISGSHTDFPVLLKTVDFPTAAIDGGSSSIVNGGGNLRAYTDDTKTTQLPLEVVTFVVGGSPDVEVYVKIPTAESGSTIYIEADDTETVQPAVTATYGRNAVWDNYYTALHLTDETDSTGNDTFTNNGCSFVNDTLATGSGDNYLVSSANGPSGSGDLSFGCVIKTSQTGTNKHVINIGTAGTDTATTIILHDGGLKFGRWGGSGITSNVVNDNASHHLRVVQNGATDKLYVDGVLIKSVTSTTQNLIANKTHIGHYQGGGVTFAYDGTVDDVVVFSGELSADWVATEYANRFATSNWVSVGTWSEGATSATLSGSATASIIETDINNGGKQIILDLTNDTWVAGTAFDAIRQDILDGLVSAQNETNGWNNVVIPAQPVTAVVRTSNTRVTITLVAA